MIVCKTASELQHTICKMRQGSDTVGFVPTMGALHEGHLSLIKRSASENKITVCSIFVNPIQFNNPEDLQKYPRTPEKDMSLIEADCEILFMPSVEEMYPSEVTEKFSFGELETVMEGACRPGHFNGVAVVVSRLFNLVKPDKAYFGAKDFQQLQIIRAMTNQLQLPVEIVSCDIIRESDGLAMSSRNMRLAKEERGLAPFIFQTLTNCIQKSKEQTPSEVIEFALHEFSKHSEFEVEYIEIAEEKTLRTINQFNKLTKARIFIAVWLGGVRLIDNLPLN
jgi:pantoate--beta-alanine ligase